MIPSSMLYTFENGKLKRTERYGQSVSNDPLPANYALFYPEKVGSANTPNMIAKIFVIRGDDRKIKEFYSSKYGNNPKFLREAVESYIKNELSNPQQTLSLERKRKLKKSKVKRTRK